MATPIMRGSVDDPNTNTNPQRQLSQGGTSSGRYNSRLVQGDDFSEGQVAEVATALMKFVEPIAKEKVRERKQRDTVEGIMTAVRGDVLEENAPHESKVGFDMVQTDNQVAGFVKSMQDYVDENPEQDPAEYNAMVAEATKQMQAATPETQLQLAQSLTKGVATLSAYKQDQYGKFRDTQQVQQANLTLGAKLQLLNKATAERGTSPAADELYEVALADVQTAASFPAVANPALRRATQVQAVTTAYAENNPFVAELMIQQLGDTISQEERATFAANRRAYQGRAEQGSALQEYSAKKEVEKVAFNMDLPLGERISAITNSGLKKSVQTSLLNQMEKETIKHNKTAGIAQAWAKGSISNHAQSPSDQQETVNGIEDKAMAMAQSGGPQEVILARDMHLDNLVTNAFVQKRRSANWSADITSANSSGKSESLANSMDEFNYMYTRNPEVAKKYFPDEGTQARALFLQRNMYQGGRTLDESIAAWEHLQANPKNWTDKDFKEASKQQMAKASGDGIFNFNTRPTNAGYVQAWIEDEAKAVMAQANGTMDIADAMDIAYSRWNDSHIVVDGLSYPANKEITSRAGSIEAHELPSAIEYLKESDPSLNDTDQLVMISGDTAVFAPTVNGVYALGKQKYASLADIGAAWRQNNKVQSDQQIAEAVLTGQNNLTAYEWARDSGAMPEEMLNQNWGNPVFKREVVRRYLQENPHVPEIIANENVRVARQRDPSLLTDVASALFDKLWTGGKAISPTTADAIRANDAPAAAVSEHPELENIQPRKHLRPLDALAIEQVEAIEGPLNYEQKLIISDEGYSAGNYLDVYGITTSGVGQTGEFADKTFKETHAIKRAETERLITDLNTFPMEIQAALVSSVYRGSLSGSPKTIELINAGDYQAAATEFLDNQEYRDARLAGETGIVDRMERTASAIAALAN